MGGTRTNTNHLCTSIHTYIHTYIHKYIHTIRYNTIQYNTIQYNTIQYNTPQYNTIQYNTIQYNTIMLGRAHIWGRVIHLCGRLPALLVFPTPRCASLLDNITAVRTLSGLPDPKNAMQCNAIRYNTIQYNTSQYNTIQYNNVGACAHLGSGNPFMSAFARFTGFPYP